MTTRPALMLLFLSLAAAGAEPAVDWRALVVQTVPLYGHRNWIVVADSAYPDQSAPGIDTVVANASEPEVLKFVLDTLAHAPHVRPEIYTDQELQFLDDKDAPGISVYRAQLAALLAGHTASTLPHEQIISRLDRVSRSFHVLLIKTNMALPYTSVFLQLGCAYWPAEAEQRLRDRMKQSQGGGANAGPPPPPPPIR